MPETTAPPTPPAPPGPLPSGGPLTEERVLELLRQHLSNAPGQPAPQASAPPTGFNVLSTPAQIAAAGTAAPGALQFAPGVLVAPTTTQNPLAGKSCMARYPHVESPILQLVATHQLEFKQLYKLTARLTRSNPPTQTVTLAPSGTLAINDASVTKAFPDMHALTDSITTYLEISAFIVGAQHSGSAGGFEHVWTIFHGASAFTQLMHQLQPTYTWTSVLAYAEQFFLSRRAEMAHGVYSGWLAPDVTLWPHLIMLPPAAAPAGKAANQLQQQQRSRAPATPGVPLAQQICVNHQNGRCSEPCPYGRRHVSAPAAAVSPGASSASSAPGPPARS